MIEYTELKNISRIISGYSFRNAVIHIPSGNYPVVQSKNLTKELYITDDALPFVNWSNVNTQAIAKNEDIVISARGRSVAAVVRSERKLVVSSSLYIIRVERDLVMPEFLVLYLNSPAGQADLQKRSTGATIKTILKGALENIEIPRLPLKEQEMVVKIYQNMQMQTKLLERWQEINSKFFEIALNKVINNF